MRGPILNTISLMEISRPLSPQISMIDFKPMLGLVFNCFRPWKARIRFSSITGTISAAILTAQKSSNGMSLEKGMLLFLAKACMNLKPTPHPQRCLKGKESSGRLGFSMATAGGITSSGTWWSQMIKSMPRLLAYSISLIALMPQSRIIISLTPVSWAKSIPFRLTPYPSS